MNKKKDRDNKVQRQIQKGIEKGGKTHGFNEDHESTLPIQTWIQESSEGKVLFIVFYSQACRWSRCLGCNLPSKSSEFHVDYNDLITQIDYVFNNLKVDPKEVKKVIVSNNGSILDQETFSSNALMHLMTELNRHFSNLAVLTIETRPEYVEVEELEFLQRAILEGDTPTVLEIAIGFEAFDDDIRNKHFDKGMSLDIFERFVEKLMPTKFNPSFGLKCYFMQKPVPEISDEEAVWDIMHAIDYLDSISEKYELSVNMHLNPTYVAYGTELGVAFEEGRYVPPKLLDVAKAVMHAKGKNVSIFIGLFDEDLAVPGGSFIREGDEEVIEKLELFNKTQNFDILEDLLRDC